MYMIVSWKKKAFCFIFQIEKVSYGGQHVAGMENNIFANFPNIVYEYV